MRLIALEELCESQKEKFLRVQVEHPDAVTLICGDEKTGERFGKVPKRKGLCKKIGGGGRNHSHEYAYQIWASWAPSDISLAQN